jgi:hypothetical protein
MLPVGHQCVWTTRLARCTPCPCRSLRPPLQRCPSRAPPSAYHSHLHHDSSPCHSPKFTQSSRTCCTKSACCKHIFQIFYMYVVFYMDVTKVALDVAYVAMAIYVCCECLFEMFHLFQTNVASVLSGYCICCSCKCMFQMFQLF